MSVKRFQVDVYRSGGCTGVDCDASHLVQVWGDARDNPDAIADLALKGLRAKIIEALREVNR